MQTSPNSIEISTFKKPYNPDTMPDMKAVILAGGGGTRLWPLSTLEKPKQFQKLVSDKTMLELTVDRLDFLKPEDIFIAINAQHLDLTRQLCPQIPTENIILEPALRDTCACIGLAAAIIEEGHPGEVMAVIYADHLIQNKKQFREKLQKAEKIAQKEQTLNIVEVRATEPNTNYGYVKLGAQIDEDSYELDRFVEKPDLETAKKFLEDGNYLWNTGIYVWQCSTLLKHYQELQPQTYEILSKIAQSGNYDSYPQLEKISLDYAIMEKVPASQVRIIRADDLGWSDIGNWEAIFNELAQSPEDNITRGPVKLLDCTGCLIYADNGNEIRAIGLHDTIIIDTPEGNLTCQKSQSHRTKELQ